MKGTVVNEQTLSTLVVLAALIVVALVVGYGLMPYLSSIGDSIQSVPGAVR